MRQKYNLTRILKRKENCIWHFLRRNCFLQVIIKGHMEIISGCWIRRMQLNVREKEDGEDREKWKRKVTKQAQRPTVWHYNFNTNFNLLTSVHGCLADCHYCLTFLLFFGWEEHVPGIQFTLMVFEKKKIISRRL